MTERDILRAALQIPRTPAARLPCLEWAHWWDKTKLRWEAEGLPTLEWEASLRHFGLDFLENICVAPHGERIVNTEDYLRVRPQLYLQSRIDEAVKHAHSFAQRHAHGEFSLRLVLDGFFWFARRLLGIEQHLFAFYDQPELMHQINQDLLAFNLQVLEQVLPIIQPDMLCLSEDMSYNHGSMLSKECFDEFIRPYYLELAKHLQGVPFFVDTDGHIDQLIPWLLESGVQGILPLERQAGVDVVALREKFPALLMLGGFDKMVMHRGETAMRAEFERLLPVWQGGGFVLSCDHQTPPAVSLMDYQLYIRLLQEYAQACSR